MKDVAALCQRVVIITQGQIKYDGSLSGIIDRFSGHKIVTLLFEEDQVPADLSHYGEVLQAVVPKAKLRILRQEIPKVLAALLDQHAVADVSVEDPPLEQVIAEVFSQADQESVPPGQFIGTSSR